MDDCHFKYITKLKGKKKPPCLALNEFVFCNLTFDSQKKEALGHENDETLPNINKTKSPKKGGIKGTKWKYPHPRRQKNHLRGQTTRGTSSSRSSSQTSSYPITRSISNKGRGGPLGEI
jgi:hypothetical protein